MAITCPRCGAEFDATLFQFGHHVRCPCGATIEYPGHDSRAGHVLAEPSSNTRQEPTDATKPETGDAERTG
jgi:hypothetical protein